MLLKDAISRDAAAAQKKCSDQLWANSNASFGDPLLCLESASRRHEEAGILQELEIASRESASDAAALIT